MLLLEAGSIPEPHLTPALRTSKEKASDALFPNKAGRADSTANLRHGEQIQELPTESKEERDRAEGGTGCGASWHVCSAWSCAWDSSAAGLGGEKTGRK